MFEITWIQAGLLALMGVLGGGVLAALGTSIGNYTLTRPLVGGLFVGLILGDVEGCIMIAIPMQIMFIALVTPGGTVSADLRAVSYIGIPLAYAMAKNQGWDMGGGEARAFALVVAAMVGTVGTVQFYGTAMMNLIWQHIGWARLDKGDFSILGKVEVVMPIISHIVISFIPILFIVKFGTDAVANFKEALPLTSWYMKTVFTLGALLPAVGISILLKSVVTKASDLVYFVAGFALAASMGLTLLAATAVGAVFALVNYKMTMMKAKVAGSAGALDDDEEDI